MGLEAVKDNEATILDAAKVNGIATNAAGDDADSLDAVGDDATILEAEECTKEDDSRQ